MLIANEKQLDVSNPTQRLLSDQRDEGVPDPYTEWEAGGEMSFCMTVEFLGIDHADFSYNGKKR